MRKDRVVVALAYLMAFVIALVIGALSHPYVGAVLTVILPLLVARYVLRTRQRWF
jgi:hypothetical protein